MEKDMDEIIREMEEYAESEGTEVGEFWAGLIHMWCVVKYDGSEEFQDALENEIRLTHSWIKKKFTWVTHSNYCDKCGRGQSSYRELVYNG